MSIERRQAFPTEEPENKKNRFERLRRNSKRGHRPVRLYVAPFERKRLQPLPGTPEERFNKLWGLLVKASKGDSQKFMEIVGDLKDVFDEKDNLDATGAQLTPLTPEEVGAQDVESTINLVKTEKTISGKINLVEKLKPEQLDKLRQSNPDTIEPVLTGLNKREARKAKAQRRILDIYKRRGEDGTRP